MGFAESSPEKAGVGGSIPSLATMFSYTYNHHKNRLGSIGSNCYCKTNAVSRSTARRCISGTGCW
jgi:hypothetical protein